MSSPRPQPNVTFVVPTFNAASTLELCLQSVAKQDYPRDLIEILVVDGGSRDSTLEIARRFHSELLANPYRYEEGLFGGKNIGFQHASGEIVIFLDSDNELSSCEWLMRTVLPYRRCEDVVGTFPHLVPSSDGTGLGRYLSKANTQPVVRFTQPDEVVVLDENEGFRVIKLIAADDLSNGASVRRDILEKVGGYDYGRETTKRLIDAGYTTFAWPKRTDVLHHYMGLTLRQLVRKRIARLRRFRDWEGQGLRSYTTSVYTPNSGDDYLRLLSRILKSLSLLTVPEAAWRAAHDRDWAWVYHPAVSFLETTVHVLLLWDLALRTIGITQGSTRQT